ncbi:NAD-dependent epimerase/dehydratase family protein [Nocardia vinacea]|uniref:NAD-dependent epimerase/dehydratase family protein n=1 Tax=Nocardia vinacea TaxID=96468 RepID=A0ABZ1YHS7_9NOCA|nr:NAD-dependent epimerase/dehydratase family protein [Nocardia vinacea]
MRVVVVGATGNVGTSVLEALSDEAEVSSIVGVARRVPGKLHAGVEWVRADVRTDDLESCFHDADVVVHLAWLFQPTHRPLVTWRANVGGTERVLRAVAAAQVPALVYASSVGAYSPCQDDRPVPESWPTDGWPPAAYMREKAYVERLFDRFEAEHPELRVVRMRPAFTFCRETASQQRRLFAGPLLPNRLIRPGITPVLPVPRGLRFQAVHSRDVGRAYALAINSDARGPFNLAAEPVIDRLRLAELFGARVVSVPPALARTALAVGWHARALPAAPELFDAVMHLPILDTGRARAELGWTPRFTAVQALRQMLAGLRAGTGEDTPPLTADAGGPLRWREFLSGVGGRDLIDQRG